jgi:hypothetical protein
MGRDTAIEPCDGTPDGELCAEQWVPA